MPKYNIPIRWESYKRISVEADNLKEACIKAVKEFLEIPDDNYIDDSWGLDEILKWEYSDEVVPYEIEIINEIYK